MRLVLRLLLILEKGAHFYYNKVAIIESERNAKSRVEMIRQKDRIKVLFILPCLAKWKTEALFKAMMENKRFEPVIGLTFTQTDFPSLIASKYIQLKEYLSARNYPFVELSTLDMNQNVNPDIVFYNEASAATNFNRFYPNSLFCYIGYCFETAKDKGLMNSLYQNACWKYFVENQSLIDYAKTVMDNKASNMVPTGLPIMDDLLRNADTFNDPWKKQNKNKKRIIWAPHHTISTEGNGLHFSVFLDIADEMIQLAKQYKNDIQIAFKPHPVLKTRLQIIWGFEKTEQYYNVWADMENTQLEEGEYMGLFKHSDAIIHDSASFIIEYLYTKKPCMFLDNGINHDLNAFSQQCFEQYYLGKTAKDIDCFVSNVINGVDPRCEERMLFYQKELIPQNGQSASQNIMNEILGKLMFS